MNQAEINHPKKWKYAQGELERRFLITDRPEILDSLPLKTIIDKYLHGTALRIRKVIDGEYVQYKFTKKLPHNSNGVMIQWVSTIYISQEEYKILMKVPGKLIRKKRYYYAPPSGEVIGIDEIELARDKKKIWIAEVEFQELTEGPYVLPMPHDREITGEERYQGNELANQYIEELK